MVDWRAERGGFSTLDQRIYFAQQCLGACPDAMQLDFDAYRRSVGLRSRALPEWAERFRELHALVERLLNAPLGSVFLRDSATAAQAAIAAALTPLGARRRVIIGSGDFHSSRYLWRAQVRRGFDVVEVATHGRDGSDGESIAAAIDERVRVVALSLVSPRSGALLDVAPIVEAARRAGALVLLDAYQAVGIVPIDVGGLGAHAVVGGFHKWLGGAGTGIAFGFVAPALSAELEPAYPGWLGHRELLGFRDEFEAAAGATKLQQGMVAMEPVYTARAGLQWVIDKGVENLRSRSLELTALLEADLSERGLPVVTPRAAARRGGMVCVDLPNGARIVEALEKDGIDIDARPGAGVRLGPHPCATTAECADVVARLAASLS